jgi:Bifunctional DNA primase/polymerase, N-terminal
MSGVTNGSVFADAGPRYLQLGWSPIPLQPGTKFPPPKNWTGYRGRRPDAAQIKRWCDEDPRSNVALRLHPDVVGVDVDAYHGGLDGLGELQANHGQLPPTWASTSRDDGSSIRLYRVPDGWHLQTDPAQGVDMIQSHHRYVVVAPSVHPEGRVYRLGRSGVR